MNSNSSIFIVYLWKQRLGKVTLANRAQKPGIGLPHQALTFSCYQSFANSMWMSFRPFPEHRLSWVDERNQELRWKCLKQRVVIRKKSVKFVFRSISRTRSVKWLPCNLRVIQGLSFQTLHMIGSYSLYMLGIMTPSDVGSWKLDFW